MESHRFSAQNAVFNQKQRNRQQKTTKMAILRKPKNLGTATIPRQAKTHTQPRTSPARVKTVENMSSSNFVAKSVAKYGYSAKN